MPYSPAKPCRHSGCPNLTHDRYCPLHAPAHQRDSAHKRGYTSKWNRRRKLYLQANLLCVECQRSGRLTPAAVVDHIIPHRGDEVLMWDETNWQPLCKPCHDKKTGRQDSRPIYKF